jgi:hypothetical protein
MATEWREETCGECGATRERVWIVKTHKVGVPVPPGYRVEKRGKTWSRIAGRTRDVSLCMCDAI